MRNSGVNVISRRGFVAGAGALGMAALAGCSGAGANGGAETAATTAAAAAATTEPSATGAVARPSTCGALTVNDTSLVGADGNAAQLKGFSTHGIAWFGQYVNAECFSELAGWGANVARLAMYTHENGGYCTDGDQAALRELLANGVQYAADADMYAIVDWHVLQDLDPNVYLAQAKEFWDWASKEFAEAENVIFEICNEPNGSTTWADVKSYAEEVLPVIRANAPTTPVLVGTPTWSQEPNLAAADPLADENVMYTLHFYAATHKDDLRSRLREVVEGGTPVFVSEYGICDASGSGSCDLDSANAWASLMDELGVSSCCWSLSNKDESASFIKSSCEKTSGFDDTDLTESGTWLKSMLAGELPEEIEGSDGAGSGTSELSLSSIEGSQGTTAKANMRQNWETDGKPYLLFDVTVGADEAASTWEATLTFSADVAVSDSWNCTAEASGATVRITPASHNASIDAGGSISDIGLIVYPA